MIVLRPHPDATRRLPIRRLPVTQLETQMAIQVKCKCGATRRVKDEAAGRTIKCRECGKPTKVPKPQPVEDEYEYEEDYGDEWGSEDAGDEWGSDYGDDEYGDYEEEAYEAPPARKPRKASSKGKKRSAGNKKKSGKGKKKKAKGASKGLAWNFNYFNLFLLAIGCVLIFGGVEEVRLASLSKPEPQQITLANLLQNGPGDNIYIELSDFLLRDNLVYEANSDSGPYTKIWIAADPATEEDKRLGFENIVASKRGPIKFLFKSTQHNNDTDIVSLATKGLDGSVRGMLINEIESLAGEERKLLEQSYGRTGIDSWYIFEFAREPSGIFKMTALFFGGIIFLLIGGAAVLFIHKDE